MWSRQLGRELYSAPVIFTASDGSGRVAVGSGDGEFFCLDDKGNILWHRPMGSAMDSSVSVGDLDTDGRADIFLVTESGVIARLDEDGNVIWTLDMKMRTDASGAIADINGDGKLEYVLCTHLGRLLVLDNSGEVIFYRGLGVNNAYNATPTFGHVMKKRPGLQMVVCGGDSGKLFCFATPMPANAVIQWGAFRRDYTMVGSWPGPAQPVVASMTPENLAWDQILTGQGVRFRIANPRDRALRAEAACTTPTGSRHAVTSQVWATQGQLILPLDVLVPGTYSFSWSLLDADGKAIASGARQVCLEPFANDRALVEKACLESRSAADEVQATLPLSAAALGREARLLADTAAALAPAQDACLRSDASSQQQAISDTAALVVSAQRAQCVAAVVRKAVPLGPGTSVIAFEGPVWDSVGVNDLLPAGIAAPLEITRRVVPGEHQAVALNLFNVTDRELQVRVLIEAPGGVTVAPHYAFPVPTSTGDVAWDALPELDETAAISIPSLSSRQLWLDTATDAAAAGDRQVTVRLEAINGAGVLEAPKSEMAVAPPETLVHIELKVLPFPMAPAGAFRLCTWAYVESSQFKDIADATYENLWSHGNNVYTITALPEATYDAQGRLAAPLDYAKLDAAITRWRGKDVVLLLNGFPALTPASGGDGYGSQAYRIALKPYLDDLVAHMAALGFDREHFALYPIDEAGGTGWPSINAQAEFGKMVRAANPGVQIYADAGGPDPAMMAAIAPYVDIWSPGVNLVSTEPEKFNIMRATGKTLWSYNCSYNNYNKPLTSGRSNKAGDVVSEYRIAGIWAFRHGLTGAGFWTSLTGPEDPWTRTRTEYLMLYRGRTRPVTSRRWEAVREGIEDFRILAALKSRLDATGAAAVPDGARAQIKRLLEVSVPQFVDGITDETALQRFRSEMLDCVEGVGESAAR